MLQLRVSENEWKGYEVKRDRMRRKREKSGQLGAYDWVEIGGAVIELKV